VGLVIAVVYLILEPQSLDRSRHQIADTVMVSAGLKPPASQPGPPQAALDQSRTTLPDLPDFMASKPSR